ncbi:MAG: hypothetical protein AAB569_05005 [Patescibacteria group bacterium]
MLSQESIRKISKPLLVSGFVLDGINKLGNFWHVIPPKLLGSDNLIANHIGNFGTSAILTSIVRNKILDNMSYFDRLEKRKGEEFVDKLKNIITFTSVAMLYIAWEGVMHPLAKGSNPEIVGDIAVALAAPL